MPIPSNLLARFEHESYFHVICKSINQNSLFLSDENKFYFLKKYHQFLFPFVDTYAYCLLDNHVHWLVKIKIENAICEYIQQISPTEQTSVQQKFLQKNDVDINKLIERQFNSFFVSYTRSYNIYYSIKGHLFESPFKRIAINGDAHLTQTIIYIHANALKHGLVKEFANYKWNSYRSFTSGAHTSLMRNNVLDWFGGVDAFIEAHQIQSDYYYRHPLEECLTLEE